MLVADADERWTIVHQDHDDPIVRRYPVPGGWLYQVSVEPCYAYKMPGDRLAWHPPQFVPAPTQVSGAKTKDSSTGRAGT